MKVFVSATSADLKGCREAVKDVLLQGDIQPVTQEVLHADHRNLPEFLDALVQSCDAVVCLTADADQHHTTGQDRCAAFEGLDDFVAQTTALGNGSHLIVTSRAMPDVLEDLDKAVIPVRRPKRAAARSNRSTRRRARQLKRSFGTCHERGPH